MSDIENEANKLINNTPLKTYPDDLDGHADLRQIEDTITLLEVVINDILDSSESILFYNQVLKQIQSRYEILLAQTAHYKPQI
jgi:hypothetical protein